MLQQRPQPYRQPIAQSAGPLAWPRGLSSTLTRRILIAIGVGLLAAILCYIRLTITGYYAGDFTWAWRGAIQLWHGLNPYHDPTLTPSQVYPFNDPLYYPLPALLVATPFTLFPAPLAAALFMGLSVGLLCFGISRDQWRRWPMLLSAPLWGAIFTVQWSPLLVASALLPALLPLSLAKPNVGLPLLLSNPLRGRLLTATGILFGTLVLAPSWPWDWWRNATQHTVFIPALVLPGALVLLAAWHWRDPSARLLVMIALMPQRAVYDQLPLWLVCRSWRQALAMALLSWVGAVGWVFGVPQDPAWILLGMYLPALGVWLWNARDKAT